MPETQFTLYWTTSPPTQLQRCKNGWTRPVRHLPLHTGRLILAEPGRDLVRSKNSPAIRTGTFTSVRVLIKRIKDYIAHWNEDAKPFEWTATADEILAKVKIVQANVKKLVDNNAK